MQTWVTFSSGPEADVLCIWHSPAKYRLWRNESWPVFQRAGNTANSAVWEQFSSNIHHNTIKANWHETSHTLYMPDTFLYLFLSVLLCPPRLSRWCWISHFKANWSSKTGKSPDWQLHPHRLTYSWVWQQVFHLLALDLSREEQFKRWGLCFLANARMLCFSLPLFLCWDKGI